jgi:predicted negative regulator of RcsB-dependent stress response
MSTYAIFMIVGGILVAGGWIAYAIWDYKQRQEEKKRPPVRSERLEKTHTELSDWAKKMVEFKSPAPPKKFPKDHPPENG